MVLTQAQSPRRIDQCHIRLFAIGQSMLKIEDIVLGWNAGFKPLPQRHTELHIRHSAEPVTGSPPSPGLRLSA